MRESLTVDTHVIKKYYEFHMKPSISFEQNKALGFPYVFMPQDTSDILVDHICDMDLGNWASEGGGTGPRVMGEPPSRTTLTDILSLL